MAYSLKEFGADTILEKDFIVAGANSLANFIG